MTKEQTPSIPPAIVGRWQRIIDLCAEITKVPAVLVMWTDQPEHVVFCSSKVEENPYGVGERFKLSPNLYCNEVLEKNDELVVEDATRDPRWRVNDDLEFGMSFYVGYPLKWPSGEFFGTICMLDRERNIRALQFRSCLQEFALSIETDLQLMQQIESHRQSELELGRRLARMEERKIKLAADLDMANNNFRLLLADLDSTQKRYGIRVARQLEERIFPKLDALGEKLQGNEAAGELLAEIRSGLGDLERGMSKALQAFIHSLTPSEREVAQLILHGQTTREIAEAIGRENSTVDFHRNNIRKKLGLKRRGENLRSALWAL